MCQTRTATILVRGSVPAYVPQSRYIRDVCEHLHRLREVHRHIDLVPGPVGSVPGRLGGGDALDVRHGGRYHEITVCSKRTALEGHAGPGLGEADYGGGSSL